MSTAICGSLHIELVIPILSRPNPSNNAIGSPNNIVPKSPNASNSNIGPILKSK